MGIRDSGHSGLFMETESTGVIDIFDIEVETLLEQASAKLKLEAFTIPLQGEAITMLAAGYKSQVEPRDTNSEIKTEGPIRKGDK
ncbi:uncharacterized protein N7484_000934 [Penicillium longicatenatum]|uniref:uncharacterized protein n=1 Tax=Penicillium longicatenatum TaxID=1561947 RepID=UPI0025498FC6|nr:uncharacterized protein N7484_000934 [Penicillium longicatenatum]KAJ5657285.1 hypothetical protein N7484_000934 [Penicillium longicatenatum]